jgi:GNAT superfamily N-acetyltransferase
MNLAIARAGMEAVAETDALIHEAADWLIARGEPLWGPDETSYDALVRVTKAGELVTGRVAGALAACMYLHGEDALFWPRARPGEAFYIHRLAVARAYAGQGFGLAMLAWAQKETRAKGRVFLRLDCEPRAKLLALYQSAGFTRIDAQPIEVMGHRVVRHEKTALPPRT